MTDENYVAWRIGPSTFRMEWPEATDNITHTADAFMVEALRHAVRVHDQMDHLAKRKGEGA